MRITIVAFVVLALCARVEAAPKRTFDLMTYTAPAGWTVTTKNGGLSLHAVDAKTKAFIMVGVAANAASAGSVTRDFQAAWTQVSATFGVTDAPQVQPTTSENGWEASAGGARGTVEGVAATVMVVTMTGHGRTMNIVVATNTDAFASALDAFVTSIEMKVPPKSATPPAPKPAPAKASATTTFDDGWTSAAEPDWVRVTREGATVFLHFPVALDDQSRSDIPSYFWSKLVAPRYAVTKLYPRPYRTGDFPYYYVQGDATDRATGKPVYVSLRVVTSNGLAWPIEVVTASDAALAKVFPTQDSIEAIMGANRFAIDANVAGTWVSSTSASMNLYYTTTGNSAGMNAAVLNDRFVLGGNGSYVSEHQGATGRVGSMTAFKERRKGTYATAPWELTVKHSDGTAKAYNAYYEMSRGGPVLHLQDKKFSGNKFTLVRAK